MEGEGVLSSGLSMAELGRRIRGERQARGLSIERLAELSGISRSMVSEVERGTKTPSVLVLDRLATALGTSISRLLDEPAHSAMRVLRHAEQRVLRDPSGWERRVLSPVLGEVEFEFMRTTIGPGVDAGEFVPHAPGSREYLAVEHGSLRLTINGRPYELAAGDSAYYPGDCHHAYANHGTTDCVFYLAMEVGPAKGPTRGTAGHHERRRESPDA
ncbi:helix-turn-helix domain-containing protein [Nonomuraea gerenzanensis]|uniref:Transcriptional regulator n=1 Tax=Nonomuraea gerenzanensis TaxID=93944 RepID=A0A1M4E9C7_9ACTN|nr:XRE family transcriptional regulator [Nonomuraea gerenzanensis]UBU17676.1 XRE family transcriptional regulator [Nonomuraea gerenzanensis]SBO95446.1 Transcriptional regulator [Nonomuraea gerenzanensis]